MLYDGNKENYSDTTNPPFISFTHKLMIFDLPIVFG